MQLTLANISLKLILISYLFQGIDIILLPGILITIIILPYESLDAFAALSDLRLWPCSRCPLLLLKDKP